MLNKKDTTQNIITKEKLEKYFDVTTRAFNKVKLQTQAEINVENAAKDYYDMAQRYIKDAHYFAEQDDWINAFAALNYAHGWLDAGARLGLFDVDNDNVLFTVDDKP